MTLKELILIRDKYFQHPELLAQKPKGYMQLIEECIASERKKMEDEHDPVLDAKIAQWIAEGRIYEGPPSFGMMS